MKISPVNIDSRKNLDMRSGDTVIVYQKIEEKGKTRIQQFEGLVLSRNHGTEPGATFTVRRTSDGYGVEKIFPLYSPVIDKIEVVKRSKTSRSKLYNIRRQAIKQISKRMKMMAVDFSTEDKSPEPAKDSVSPKDSEEKNANTKESEPVSTTPTDQK
ncbi:MAG TPA: 50S ribosomal protein L19 [Candidatus Paceibacterota bacterium]|nr:50S ribosomal protein L19 [Candidatus Paceibacterota bacterium]HMP18953.1 50S ribosomal protein L19 [Candidatus Paceibacterota bacterium]HMP85446.1 50S ribosomal protein L19 [Candidatus Paceibacterota bacterium]